MSPASKGPCPGEGQGWAATSPKPKSPKSLRLSHSLGPVYPTEQSRLGCHPKTHQQLGLPLSGAPSGSEDAGKAGARCGSAPIRSHWLWSEVMLPCGYLTSVLGVISHSPDSLMVTSSVVGPSILASVMPCGWGSDSSWSTVQPGPAPAAAHPRRGQQGDSPPEPRRRGPGRSRRRSWPRTSPRKALACKTGTSIRLPSVMDQSGQAQATQMPPAATAQEPRTAAASWWWQSPSRTGSST